MIPAFLLNPSTSGANDFNLVGREFGISGENRHVFNLGLSNEQAVEGIAMVKWQPGGLQGMAQLNGKWSGER